jgi:hypothetical protein
MTTTITVATDMAGRSYQLGLLHFGSLGEIAENGANMQKSHSRWINNKAVLAVLGLGGLTSMGDLTIPVLNKLSRCAT